jgi:hypothetical protein
MGFDSLVARSPFEPAKDGNADAVVCGRDKLGSREIGRSSFCGSSS